MARQHNTASTLQRLLRVALLLALLATQTLAHMHGVLHGAVDGREARGQAHSAGHAAGDAAHEHHHAEAAHMPEHADGRVGAQAELNALFSGHGEAADCRLFDQACGGEAAVPILLVALPAMPPAHLLRTLLGLFVARWAASFDARGPPALV